MVYCIMPIQAAKFWQNFLLPCLCTACAGQAKLEHIDGAKASHLRNPAAHTDDKQTLHNAQRKIQEILGGIGHVKAVLDASQPVKWVYNW